MKDCPNFDSLSTNMIEKLRIAADYIRSRTSLEPTVGIVLGSGLGNFTREIEVACEIPYADIPGFPVSTVKGHSGKLILGQLSGKKVVAMAGRFHCYEGYSASEIVFPIRVMKLLGVKVLLLSNAAGGVNRNFKVGDLMLIRDHVSQFVPNPLIGKNFDELGPRFPDMAEPYDLELIRKAGAIASAAGIGIHEGVYICVTGPTFETPAEYRMIDRIGGDAVGMSTVQEVIAAVHMGMRCFAMSVITDLGLREGEAPISHEEVLEAARSAEPKLSLIFRELTGML
jgi:purine-nucleoside phosphorylase